MKTLISALAIMLVAMASRPGGGTPKSDVFLEAGGLKISEPGYKLIMEFEVGGGEPYYNRYLQSPEWPGESSGVTIGVGYDLGYNTRDQIAKDWSSLPKVTVARLQSCSGIKGSAAKLKIHDVKDIVIPWGTALAVYNANTVPRFASLTRKAYAGTETLHPSVQGAMLSWVFNRGDGVGNGPRDLEKRQIRAAIPSRVKELPGYFRASQRLWPSTPGLTRRRRAEAALIESTL